MSDIAQVVIEGGNIEDTESEDDTSIIRRKLETESEESVAHAVSEDNDSAPVIVPRNNILPVFDVKDESRRKRRKYMPQGNGGNGDSNLSDDLGQTRSKKMPKLQQN